MSSPLITSDIEKEEVLDEEPQEEKEPPYKVLIHRWIVT